MDSGSLPPRGSGMTKCCHPGLDPGSLRPPGPFARANSIPGSMLTFKHRNDDSRREWLLTGKSVGCRYLIDPLLEGCLHDCEQTIVACPRVSAIAARFDRRQCRHLQMDRRERQDGHLELASRTRSESKERRIDGAGDEKPCRPANDAADAARQA